MIILYVVSYLMVVISTVACSYIDPTDKAVME